MLSPALKHLTDQSDDSANQDGQNTKTQATAGKVTDVGKSSAKVTNTQVVCSVPRERNEKPNFSNSS